MASHHRVFTTVAGQSVLVAESNPQRTGITVAESDGYRVYVLAAQGECGPNRYTDTIYGSYQPADPRYTGPISAWCDKSGAKIQVTEFD